MTHTLFGYDRLAKAMHKGNVGIKTGASSRPAGASHLFDLETGRTACGKQRGQMWVTHVPENVDESTWVNRIHLCRQCGKHAGAI